MSKLVLHDNLVGRLVSLIFQESISEYRHNLKFCMQEIEDMIINS